MTPIRLIIFTFCFITCMIDADGNFKNAGAVVSNSEVCGGEEGNEKKEG